MGNLVKMQNFVDAMIPYTELVTVTGEDWSVCLIGHGIDGSIPGLYLTGKGGSNFYFRDRYDDVVYSPVRAGETDGFVLFQLGKISLSFHYSYDFFEEVKRLIHIYFDEKEGE